MRIIFFNYEYPPLGGGAGNATAYILKEFSQIPDLEVDLITSSPDEKYQEEKIGNSITIYKLPIGKKPKNLHFQSQKDLLVYSWKAYFFAKKLMLKKKYDLSHSFFTIPCGFLSYLLKKSFGTPYIVSLRGSDVPGYSERFTFLYVILKPLVRRIWSKASKVISNSQGLLELAKKTNLHQEIEVIFNGIDTKEFCPAENKPEIFKILCVSRITERKGIRYLIEAMQNLPENIILEIVGEGNEKEKLEKLTIDLNLEKRVLFSGMINHSNLPKVYQSASIFVLPSLNEGMSNTMLEALASGLPLLATDTGGTRELLANEENGFIVKMKDSQDIAEKIKSIIENPELQIKMGISSRKMAENLNWGKVAKNYFQLYQNAK